MSGIIHASQQENDWNVITSPWLEVMCLCAECKILSPLDALNQAVEIRCITGANPLDVFAAHRFLLTLLYWKADVAGGIEQLRTSLLNDEVPQAVIDAIKTEVFRFRMFDGKVPFLQDPSAQDTKKNKLKSAGSLYSEFATKSNIAHFHHGDDENVRLCLPCATAGMLRVIPWTQSGGAGLTPSIHNAPPVMVLASGRNLSVTLGLNLIPLSSARGNPKWSGEFAPSDKNKEITYLEAFTWNPRRIHFHSPQSIDICWRCGREGVIGIGPIVYVKNENTKAIKKGQVSVPFKWQDPSAFYTKDKLYVTIKSSYEEKASDGSDLMRLLSDQGAAPTSLIVEANAGHEGWCLVVPCTNPKNNKTYDHRSIEVKELSVNEIRPTLSDCSSSNLSGCDGWNEPRTTTRMSGCTWFTYLAAHLLTDADWMVLSVAAYQKIHASPAAFDIFSGLLWALRNEEISGYPSRRVAWLILKLMASVPACTRIHYPDADFNPLKSLPKRQLPKSRYPVSFPRGLRLEVVLRNEINKNMCKRTPKRIDWPGLCYSLNQLID